MVSSDDIVWHRDAAGMLRVIDGTSSFEVTTTARVCTTVLARRRRGRDRRQLARACARLPGCLPGHEAALKKLAGHYDIARFLEQVPEARAGFTDSGESNEKSRREAMDRFLMQATRAEIERVESGASRCEDRVCKQELEELRKSCEPLVTHSK